MSRNIILKASSFSPLPILHQSSRLFSSTALRKSWSDKSNFLEDFLTSNKPPQESIQYFSNLPWTKPLFNNNLYKPIPFFSRHHDPSTGENHFFSQVLSSDTTVPHTLSFCLNSFKTPDPVPTTAKTSGILPSPIQTSPLYQTRTSTSSSSDKEYIYVPFSKTAIKSGLNPGHVQTSPLYQTRTSGSGSGADAEAMSTKPVSTSSTQDQKSAPASQKSGDKTAEKPEEKQHTPIPHSPEVLVLMSLQRGLDAHPSIMHGGLQCVLFDEVIRLLILLHQQNIYSSSSSPSPEQAPRDQHFTVKLDTKFFAPVRTPSEVLVKAWLVRREGREGRKWVTRAQILDKEGAVLTGCESVWVTARRREEE